MEYWDDPKFYEQRNKEMYEDKMAGMSNAQLVGKYGISQNRVYQIVNKIKQSNKFKEV